MLADVRMVRHTGKAVGEADIHLYLIRHAESAMNTTPELISGRTNETPLTGRGVMQARHLGRYLVAHDVIPGSVHVSPAVRTQQTARYCLKEMGLELEHRVHDNLQELDQGDWAGLVRAEIYTDEVLGEIERLGMDFKAPSGESMREVGARMEDWLQETFDDYQPAEAPETHLVFTHGVAIRSLVGRMLGWDNKRIYQTITDNTSLTMLDRNANEWQVQYVARRPE
jgi:probable phosphoglycerate mutase